MKAEANCRRMEEGGLGAGRSGLTDKDGFWCGVRESLETWNVSMIWKRTNPSWKVRSKERSLDSFFSSK